MAGKFGGEPNQYHEFVSERLDKGFWCIRKEYCEKNNIDWKCKRERDPTKWRETKLRKLSLYFNQDQKEFEMLVDSNPHCGFRQLLHILKEQNVYNFDPQDEKAIRRMKMKLWREEEQRENWLASSRLIEPKEKQAPIEKVEEPAAKTEQVEQSVAKSDP